MEKRLSIEHKCFDGLRAALDAEMQEAVSRMLDMRQGECTIGMKIKVELAGVDEAGRRVPEIHYTISSSIPVKRDAKFRLNEQVLLDEGPDGIMIIQEYEQTSMV